jgi:1-aminocyclopropane-1-carboxylate deaminase/D-cysteine desulfhydrase-like pyridoxal-dependent ACC family enzyme
MTGSATFSIAGFAGQDRPRRVIGIDASAKLEETRAQVAKIARNTAELIGLGRELREEEITVLGGWAGDYYGVPTSQRWMRSGCWAGWRASSSTPSMRESPWPV